MQPEDTDKLTVDTLLNQLEADGYTDDVAREAARLHLKTDDDDKKVPFFIQLLLGVGAWFAGLFFLVALGFADLLNDEGAMLVAGIVILTPALLLSRKATHVFPVQLSLAMMMLGQVLVIASTVMLLDNAVDELLMCGVMTAALAVLTTRLSPLTVNRFLGPLCSAWFLTGFVHENVSPHGVHVMILLCAALVGAVFCNDRVSRRLIPFGYAMVVAVFSITLFMQQYSVWDEPETPMWPLQIVFGLALIGAIVWTAGKDRLKHEPVACALILAAVLSLVSAPGLLASLALITVGYARDNRVLTGIGVVHVPVFLVYFYYALDMDLLSKSWLLMGCGLILLLARWGLSVRPWAQTKEEPT
jgi:uncharacterized membrane protein